MYFAFEGGEGSGKGTIIDLLYEELKVRGHKVIPTIEPGGTDVGGHIREVLLNKRELDIHGRTETLLFNASRAQLIVEVVEPYLGDGYVILSDRTFHSTMAYQGYGRGEDLEQLERIIDFTVGGTRPYFVLLLDVDEREGIKRKKGQRELSRIDAEGIEFHERVRAGYLKMAAQNPDVWVVIDANQPIEKVFEDVLAFVLSKIED